MQVPTALDPSDERVEFLSTGNRDIVAVVKSGENTAMTQLHRLQH